MVGYTSIEQAKKLIEIGIDANTADMHYFPNIKIPGVLSYSQMFEHFKAKQSELNDSGINSDVPYLIPCWSTEALLKLLPKEINRTDNYILDNILVYPNKGYCISYRNLSNYENKEQIMYVSDTLLECAFEMIVKLKEKGIL